jgi:hypothetical protein
MKPHEILYEDMQRAKKRKKIFFASLLVIGANMMFYILFAQVFPSAPSSLSETPPVHPNWWVLAFMVTCDAIGLGLWGLETQK